MTDIDKEHQVYMRGEWTDPEPDTLYVSVHSSRRNSEKFVVFSGNATWLNLEQAKEVREFLDGAIKFMERDSKRVKKREKKSDAKFVAVNSFKDGDIVGSQTVAGYKGRVFYVDHGSGEVGIVWEDKDEDDGISWVPADEVDFISRPERPILKEGDKVAVLNKSVTGVVDMYWDPEKYNTFAVKVIWDDGGGGYPNFWEITPVWYNFKVGDRVKAAKTFTAEINTQDDEGDDVVLEGWLGTVTKVFAGTQVGVKFDKDSWEYVVPRGVLVRERNE